MCGIVGGERISSKELDSSLEIMRHRGPDASGTWFEESGTVALGHVRLAILDLTSEANQPMVCTTKGNVIVFNGEIYNYKALREELVKLGWLFRTSSDTEVLLSAYGQWGAECLQRLNGMFAFGVYDAVNKQIYFARDRIGKKPLYYSLWNNELVFGSEIKAILAARPDMPRDMDYRALKEYMDIGYIPGELSIYKHVHKLEPACHAVYDFKTKAFSKHPYWTLSASCQQTITEDEAAEELESLIREAVKIRLQSDVPVGVFLSGGLDSCLIAAVAARENPDLVAYTAKFPMSRYDESAVAKRVADSLGIQHRMLQIEATDGSILEKLACQFDEPFGDSSLISQAIRRHVKVALSGDGGDELFAGYDYYALTQREMKWSLIPETVRKAFSQLHKLMPVGMHGKNFLRRLPHDGVERFLFASFKPEHDTIAPFNNNIDAILSGLPADDYRRNILRKLQGSESDSSLTLLQEMTLLDLFSYLPDDVLVKVDRASMLASLEVRSPLLDYRIVEFAFGLPDHMRLKGDIRKCLLKKIARKYLPKDFPYDRKQGFSIPEAEWFNGPWSGLLDTSADGRSQIFEAASVAKIRRMHIDTGRYGRHLFKILMLQLFEANYGKT